MDKEVVGKCGICGSSWGLCTCVLTTVMPEDCNSTYMKIDTIDHSQLKDLKYDDGKARWDLVDMESLEGIAKVLEFGARKYEANSWQGIDSERYFAALMRHLTAIRRGERLDSESGLRHIDHAMCNLMFLSWKDLNHSSD